MPLHPIYLNTNDTIWASVLSDLGAVISSRGINFQAPSKKISIAELLHHVGRLKARHLAALGAFGKLSESEERLVLLLPAAAAELKSEMGYADASNTHTIETLVYNIRKKMGNEFIKLRDGKYEL